MASKTMPVVREVPGQQEIYTRDHGTITVAGVSFMDGGFHIVRTPNGGYMHSNGLPIKDESQLQKALAGSPDELEKALHWFRHRHEERANAPRPIGFNPEGVPCFADGSVVTFDDLYAYFKPGPLLTAAIVSLQNYLNSKPAPETGFQEAPAPAPAPQVEAAPAPAPAPKKAAPKAKSKAGKAKSNLAKAKPALNPKEGAAAAPAS